MILQETSGTGQRPQDPRTRFEQWIEPLLELLETVVLLTGFDNPVGAVDRLDWLVYWNGKSFDAARSNEAADENAVATFAYRIMLNVRGLQGNQDDK